MTILCYLLLLSWMIYGSTAQLSAPILNLLSPPRCFFENVSITTTSSLGACLTYSGHAIVVHYYSDYCKSDYSVTKGFQPYSYACPHGEPYWKDSVRHSCGSSAFVRGFDDNLPFESLHTQNTVCMIQPSPQNPQSMWVITGINQFTSQGTLQLTQRAIRSDPSDPVFSTWDGYHGLPRFITFTSYANQAIYYPTAIPFFNDWTQYPNGFYVQINYAQYPTTAYPTFNYIYDGKVQPSTPLMWNFTLFNLTHHGIREWYYCTPSSCNMGGTNVCINPIYSQVSGLELGPQTSYTTDAVRMVWCKFLADCDLGAGLDSSAGCPTHGLCPTDINGIPCGG